MAIKQRNVPLITLRPHTLGYTVALSPIMTLKASRPRTRKLRRIAKERRINVRREEFNHLIDMLNERGEVLNTLLRDQRIQFQRIAQIQAELDLMKQAWARQKLESSK